MSDEPVWQSNEWQQARKELLQDKCQQCSSTDKLSLVHLWKPPKYHSLRLKIEAQIIEELIEKGKISPFDSSKSESQRQSCPRCHSINLRERKTKLPKFKCGRCSEEFNDGIIITVRDEYHFNQYYREWKKNKLVHMETRIDKEIKEQQNKYNHDYRTGKGTTTMCRKCSFLWTQKRMKLCENCKQNYHNRRYDVCYTCYQEDHLIICEKCGTNKITPQPGGINICEDCYEKMWDELTE